jgi:hypothetical protein
MHRGIDDLIWIAQGNDLSIRAKSLKKSPLIFAGILELVNNDQGIPSGDNAPQGGAAAQ